MLTIIHKLAVKILLLAYVNATEAEPKKGSK